MAKYIDLANLKENLTNFLNKKIDPTYAKKTEIPSDVSELNNDKNYQTAEEVDKTVTDGVAKIVAGAPEDFDTLKEMSDWISSHETSAAAMNSAISDNSAAIAKHTANSDIHVMKEEKTKWNKLDSDLRNGTIIVAEATKATQDSQGNIIDKMYAKKTEIPQEIIVDDELSATNENPVQNKIVKAEFDKINSNISHNIPRLIPKDITSYYNDGTLWQRLNGTNGFQLYEDIFVGDYFKMSRPISAYNQNQNYQATGSQYVTIAGIDTMWGNGDNITMAYHHLVMIPGMGFGGTQHFGKSRMNPSNTTVGGYVGSEMYTTIIGDVTTSGLTDTTATINQQLYAEFGSHLKTTRELLSNSLNSTGNNRFGEAGGCSNRWDWYSCQAVLMSEVEVYGSIVWSSSGFDTGIANKQLPLFANSKQAINNRSAWYWLKDVASASYFCRCNDYGHSSCSDASNADGCVRPRFVIAA